MIRRRYGHHPYYRTVVLRVRRKVVVPQMYVADTGAALTPSSAFHGSPPHTPSASHNLTVHHHDQSKSVI